MCGIVGSFNQFMNADTVNLLYHRGPDAQGLISETIGGEKLYLGHTRLSIQDLSSAGSQPMTTACQRFSIIFNGEIYNHFELRKKLKNIDFKGHSDTETILYYIAEFGIESIKDFNGIFSFGFIDRRSNKLFLARDPFGVKPMYYRSNDRSIMFSSEMKTLLKLSEADLDYQRLYTFLSLRFNPSPQTLFKDIHKLEPGHFLVYSLDERRITDKVHYSYKPQKSINISENEALIQYEHLLKKAVERQLLADVPVSVLLSGGVDSALVTKIAQDISHKKLSSFTAGYSVASSANELKEARESARILGTDHHEVILDEQDFFKSLPLLVKSLEEPLGSQSIFPIHFLSEEIHRHGFKVALTGQGVDEPWGGYGRYNTEILFDNLPKKILKQFASFGEIFSQDKIRRGFRAATASTRIERFAETYAVFNKDMIEHMTNDIFQKRYLSEMHELLKTKFDYLSLNEYKGVDAMMILDSRMNLSDDLLLYTDKISMLHSLELRVPFLDIELMQFAESLPYNLKVNFFKNKILHKKLSEKFLPKEIIYRKKKGFYTPRKEWFKGKLGKVYCELLMEAKGTFALIFNKEYIRREFKMHQEGKVNNEKQLFLLIVMYYWLDNFIDNPYA